MVDPDEPQPIDQAIDELVRVLLQKKPELERSVAHTELRRTVEALLEES